MMSDDPRDPNGDSNDRKGTEQGSAEAAPGVARKPRPPAAGQPSFEDVMRATTEKPTAARAVVIKRAQPVPQPAKAQPSFEDIMAGVAVSPEQAEAAANPQAAPAAASAPPPPQGRGPRGKGKDKDARRMPLVVKKPVLGRAGEAEKPAEPGSDAQAAGADAPAAEAASVGSPQDGKAARARAREPLAESVYAQPTAEETADFAALFAEQQSQPAPARLRPGAKVKVKVAHLGAEVAFLDLGGKGEGIIDLRELRDDKGELQFPEGAELDGYVLSMGDGTVVITRSVPKGAGREVLQEALQSRLPVEGTVTGVNKGGLEVDLGGLRGFCPASQIDVRFVEDTQVFVGQKLKFVVQEIRGGNAILSRRALLEEERKGQAVELRKTLEVGAVLEGTVTSVRDFGAFVDLGGLEGLVHVSELSHARTAHAQDVVKPGQRVRVQVLRIDPPGKDAKGASHKEERIALSLRALEQDPWDAARPQLETGRKLQGKVARLQPFGAFVELFPGVDGLVHVSALSDRHVAHPREVVKEGEAIWVQVDSVDDSSRRVALRRITEDEARSPDPVPAPQRAERGERQAAAPRTAAGPRAKVGDVVDAKVERVEAFGVFVAWAAGKGLVPNAELGTPRGSDNKKTTPVGTEFKAQIIEIDDRGRFRLSRTSAERAEGRADYERYQRANQPAGKGLGTLGDLIRAKMQQRALDED